MNFNDKLVYNIVTYNFCMIPHSLTFSFIFGHFGLKQNPTGLQEVIQRLDKNSKTILIIKSTLERSFLMKKYQKNAFLKMSVFTEYNLVIQVGHLGRSSKSSWSSRSLIPEVKKSSVLYFQHGHKQATSGLAGLLHRQI